MKRKVITKKNFNAIGLKPGFTLLEVMIGLALTALVAGAVFQAGVVYSRKIAEGRFPQIARALAWKRIVELESMPVTMGKSSGDFGSDFPIFSYQQEITRGEVRNYRFDGLYKVNLKIFWRSDYVNDFLETETFIVEYPEKWQ
ncbi:MAG: prepilin-type N-terminal cleavage/methylation domain-containing protein [Candidatus Riflebacteria bacterium]|nr:prepilin-type N-terminal cleavage/methylation domain-containing protein [Candidatus Riflebacteria bacterium]